MAGTLSELRLRKVRYETENQIPIRYLTLEGVWQDLCLISAKFHAKLHLVDYRQVDRLGNFNPDSVPWSEMGEGIV